MRYTVSMQKSRKLQPLTKKQEAFFEEVSKGAVPYEAARKVYNCKNDNVARVLASRNSKHPVVYETVRDLMESKGSRATVKHILKAIEDGLQAERVIVTKSGDILREPNHSVRIKAAELALKVKGELHFELPIEHGPRDIRVNFNLIKARDVDEIKRLTQDVITCRPTILEG